MDQNTLTPSQSGFTNKQPPTLEQRIAELEAQFKDLRNDLDLATGASVKPFDPGLRATEVIRQPRIIQ